MIDFTMDLPRDVEFIINRLEAEGYHANVVGGAVRDSLLSRPLGDFDITTDATPEEIKAVFADLRTIDTGIKHGTVTVVIDHTPYEITTYRIDGDYKDNRHPDSVTFTRSLSEDLRRRDFTVNAMAYNPREGLTDLFGGVDDAKNRLIRAVGDAKVRFDEDALRILRGLRFSSVLGFDIEDKTAEAIREKAPLLSGVSSERIYQEMKKLLLGSSASRTLRSFADTLSLCLGGVDVRDYPTDEELFGASLSTRFALVFLLNSDSPIAAAERAFDLLKADNSTRSATKGALLAYERVDFSERSAILHSLADLGRDDVYGALSLGLITGRFTVADKERIESVMADDPVYTVAHLALGGHDLAALGYRGRAIGEALAQLLDAVIDGRCVNDKNELIGFLNK